MYWVITPYKKRYATARSIDGWRFGDAVETFDVRITQTNGTSDRSPDRRAYYKFAQTP